jgi:phospholipid transport system substrate-binding protein
MIARLSIILAICSLLAASASGANPQTTGTVSPLDYTRSILAQASTIVAGNQPHEQKVAALSVVFARFLDTDAMGRESLGQHWSSFTPAQQKEFLPLFRELIEDVYVQDLLLFQSPDFVYVGQKFTGSGAVVDTKIVTTKDKFDVSYTMVPVAGKWMATTITVEGISLVANYSNQFNRVLERMTPDDLIALMRRKFGNPSGTTPS